LYGTFSLAHAMLSKFAAVTPMKTLMVAIMMEPMTTGP
jgi:hypothetical protein